ncbi:MAG: diguanylate cyclase [Geobacteraceae bacterium GWC2_58_44]|nr:MAG: diguanylate cyclase [Geobacteraceae bacterium GWC2_58_44]
MAVSLVAVIVLSVSVLRIIQLERGRPRAFLAAPLLALALLELFDLCAVSGIAPQFPWKSGSLYVEALLPLLWLLLSLTHARESAEGGVGRWVKLMLGVTAALIAVPALLPANALFYAPDFPAERILFLTDAGYYYYVVILVLLVTALTNFEATLVNASPDALWRVKLEIVALGSMLAVLIFYYSHALLYRTLNMELVPLRSLLFVVATLMMSYSRTHWRGTARVKISQTVLLRSVVLAVVSGYLLLLGALGEGMKYFGPLFPRVLTLSLAFLSGMILLLLLLSERLKREIKVFLHKNFYQSKYDYRAQWLGLTERLATFESGEELLKRVLSAYCDIFGVKGGALFQHQEGCGWFCATAIQDMEQIKETLADDNALLSYLRQRRWVFCSKDDNPDILAENRELIEKHMISFVIPFFESEILTGFIVLGEQVVPGEQYRYEDYDLMKTIARQASIAIQHQRLSDQLTQAKAMEAVGNLATFVVHDLKNLAATISLVVENAGQHLDNPEFQKDMLSSLGNTSQKMHGLIGRLRNLGESELLHMRPVDLLALAERSARLVQGHPITVQGSRETVMVDEEEVQKVVLNLFLNGVEASQQGAPILAEVGFAGAPFIRVTDKGCGMSPRFVRSELFAPFHTTKLTGLGIGLYQCRQIIAAHGGRIEVSSVEGDGTVFTVWFPVAATEGVGVITQAA